MLRLQTSTVLLSVLLFLSTALTSGLAQALPFDGSAPGTASISAKHLIAEHPFAVDDFYWMDPDGPVAANSALMFADMSSFGGGWTLGILSLDASPVLSFGIASNSGIASLADSHTRNVVNLAESRDAEIWYEVRNSTGLIFQGIYTGRFSDMTPVFSTTVDSLGLNGSLDSSFDFHRSDRNYDVSVYVRELTTPTPVPEPSTALLLGFGLSLLASRRGQGFHTT